jgi:hypothetical protein
MDTTPKNIDNFGRYCGRRLKKNDKYQAGLLLPFAEKVRTEENRPGAVHFPMKYQLVDQASPGSK